MFFLQSDIREDAEHNPAPIPDEFAFPPFQESSENEHLPLNEIQVNENVVVLRNNPDNHAITSISIR